ncbi:MAG: tyrosine-type recombinase/integrase [Flavobacteriia bacterium]|jgi:integrase/recombinase XerC
MAPFFMLQNFENYLSSEKRYSQHTVEAYLSDLKQFIEFTDLKDDKDWKEVDFQLIRSWIVYLNEENYENKSINRKLATLRTFFKFLLKSEVVEFNPTTKINGPKQRKKLPSFVKEADLKEENLDILFKSDFEGTRDRLIFETLYQTGIRLSELIELKEINVSSNSIKVLGKRNKERIIPISEKLTNLISQYKDLKNNLLNKNELLFCLENGNKLYPKFVYRKINYYLSLATSLNVKSPHILRHTFATHMLNNGAGLETLKELLGHSTLAATQVYTHNSFAQLTNIYSSAHPRGHKKD